MHDDKIKNRLKPGLYCVATPIGNLSDITERAVEILSNSSTILCEDTRVSKKLLNHFKIKKGLISYHKFNEREKLNEIIEILKSDKIVSLISDAGTPAISDPGRILIQECVKKNINIYPIPGASAVSSAISISGFSDKYFFIGFLPEKKGELIREFEKVSNIGCSVVFFISPIKFFKIIELIKKSFLNRELLICRELTKFHEQYIRTSVNNLHKVEMNKKGEITVVISESKNSQKKLNELEESDKKRIKKFLKIKTIKNIVKIICDEKNISKKIVYDYCLKVKNDKI